MLGDSDLAKTIRHCQPIRIRGVANTRLQGTSPSLPHLIPPDLRCLRAAMRHGDEQVVPIRHEKAGASAAGRRNFREALVMIRIGLLDDVEIALATDRVKTSSFCVVENVVCVAGDIECRDCVS